MPGFTASSSTSRDRLARWLERQWYRIGPWHALLVPLSWLFGLVAGARRLAYRTGLCRSVATAVPVIVIGNISVGGTGKTPLVAWLAARLRQAGFTPGIISRGYGRNHDAPRPVDPDGDARQFGDEPLLLARRTGCPVWVGHDRVAALQALLQAHPACNVVISDDGLQHYRMRRAVELAVVDAERGFGNRLLLPAGPLREPPSRLTRVDAVIYNGGGEGDADYVLTLRPGEIRNLQDARKTLALAALRRQKVHAVAGIGNPQRFFRQLADLDIRIEPHAFPDHHDFKPEDFAAMADSTVLMTEKDAVKCVRFARPDWWYLPVDAVVDQALADDVVKKLRENNGH